MCVMKRRHELQEQPDGSPPVPSAVCVDLDGTLVAADLHWESFVYLAKHRPWRAVWAALGLLEGRARFKQHVAREVTLDPASLPYRDELVQRLTQLRRSSEAPVLLVTAADESYARSVADHLGLFTEVLASDGRMNLSGKHKAALLVEKYGQGNFDYFGNDWKDVEVWRAANGATAVAASPRLVRRVSLERPLDQLGSRGSTQRLLLRALRPHQWVKNLLVFVPMILAHAIVDPGRWLAGVLAFIAFCCCASAIYIFNDILDIPADRVHPRKRLRPFASGDLSIPLGIVMAVLLLSAGLLTAIVGVSWWLAATALVYIGFTTAYSMALKSQPVVDVFALTGLYILRIVGGSVATSTRLSSWFVGFALFFFLSLAFVKRYTELVSTNRLLAGRGYGPIDASWIQAIGMCAGYMAVLILALYINAPDVSVLYERPQILWMLCPLLLFWITRLWFRASHKLVHDDPVVEALRDPASYVIGTLVACVLAAAV